MRFVVFLALAMSSPSLMAIESAYLVRPFLRHTIFSLSHYPTSDQKAEYVPHSGTEVGASFSYHNLGFELSQSRAPNEDEISRKGSTDITKFVVGSWITDGINVEGYFLDYQGFYNASVDPYTIHSQMNLSTYGVTAHWVLFPEDFSLAALQQQSMRQTSSGFSPLVSFGLSNSRAKDVPDLASLTIVEAHTMLGLGGTLALGSMYIAASVLGGPALHYLNNKTKTGSQIAIIAGLGWNGPTWITALTLKGERLDTKLSGRSFALTRNYAELAFGMRF